MTWSHLPFGGSCQPGVQRKDSGRKNFRSGEHCRGFLKGCCAVLSHSVMSDACDPMDCSPPGSSVHGDSPGKNTGVGCHALLKGIFPTQGLNPGLPHCRQFLYHLNHQGSPSILNWVSYLFSQGTSQPRNQTRVSCIAGRFFTAELSGKPLID